MRQRLGSKVSMLGEEHPCRCTLRRSSPVVGQSRYPNDRLASQPLQGTDPDLPPPTANVHYAERSGAGTYWTLAEAPLSSGTQSLVLFTAPASARCATSGLGSF